MDIKTLEKNFFDLKKNNTIFDINCYIPFYQDDFLDDDIPTPEQILTEGVDKLVLADKYCLVDEIYEANQKLLDRVATNDAFYASPVILPASFISASCSLFLMVTISAFQSSQGQCRGILNLLLTLNQLQLTRFFVVSLQRLGGGMVGFQAALNHFGCVVFANGKLGTALIAGLSVLGGQINRVIGSTALIAYAAATHALHDLFIGNLNADHAVDTHAHLIQCLSLRHRTGESV